MCYTARKRKERERVEWKERWIPTFVFPRIHHRIDRIFTLGFHFSLAHAPALSLTLPLDPVQQPLRHCQRDSFPCGGKQCPTHPKSARISFNLCRRLARHHLFSMSSLSRSLCLFSARPLGFFSLSLHIIVFVFLRNCGFAHPVCVDASWWLHICHNARVILLIALGTRRTQKHKLLAT